MTLSSQPLPVRLSQAARTPKEKVKLARLLKRARRSGKKVFIYGIWSRLVIEVIPDQPLNMSPGFVTRR